MLDARGRHPAEKAHHLFGTRVCGEIEILGPVAQNEVAHRSADEIAFVASIVKHAQYPLDFITHCIGKAQFH